MITKEEIIRRGKFVLDHEARYLKKITHLLDNNFVKAVTLIENCTGHIIVMGVGKSGIVGVKIAASFASLGTPAYFVHASEAVHGDFGMIKGEDVVLLLSNSGETGEIINVLPYLQQRKVPIISMSRDEESTLANASDVHLCTYVDQEADPRGIAPTTSAIVTLALGDALALTLADIKGFTKKDFLNFHPGGNIGKEGIVQ